MSHVGGGQMDWDTLALALTLILTLTLTFNDVSRNNSP
jgi:hypothetical protein